MTVRNNIYQDCCCH